MIGKEEIKGIITTQELKGELGKTIEIIPPKTQEKSCTPTTQAQEITPDETYTGLSKVNVGAIPEEYVIPSGTQNINENGTYDIKMKEYVNVNIGGGIEDIDDWNNAIKSTTDSFLHYLDIQPLSNEPIIDEPITLYTPKSDYIYYIIVKSDRTNQYGIAWQHKDKFPMYDTRNDKWGLKAGAISYYDYSNIYRENGIFVQEPQKYCVLTGYGEQYYSNYNFDTIEELINAVKNNEIRYYNTTGYCFNVGTVIASNSTVLTGNTQNYQDNAVLKNLKRISNNETIQVIE